MKIENKIKQACNNGLNSVAISSYLTKFEVEYLKTLGYKVEYSKESKNYTIKISWG